jgi:hypothetical protein
MNSNDLSDTQIEAENKIAAFDLILDAILSEYENATEEQRELLSPFCKFFYDLVKTEKPQHNNAAACPNLLKLNAVEGFRPSNSHSSIA